MNFTKILVPVAACIAGTLPCTASQAQDAQSACASVTSLQKRIVERADQGIESLRSFVWTARVVHGIGMEDVQTGLDSWRAAVTCQQQVAAAAAAAQVAGTHATAPEERAEQVVTASR